MVRRFPCGREDRTPVLVATKAPITAEQPTATREMSAATASPANSESNNAVSISNFDFEPDSLSVKVGTTVTWTNQDNTSHTITADNGEFKSGMLGNGDTFSFTFTTAPFTAAQKEKECQV
jgi:plastocyanin